MDQVTDTKNDGCHHDAQRSETKQDGRPGERWQASRSWDLGGGRCGRQEDLPELVGADRLDRTRGLSTDRRRGVQRRGRLLRSRQSAHPLEPVVGLGQQVAQRVGVRTDLREAAAGAHLEAAQHVSAIWTSARPQISAHLRILACREVHG